MISAIKKRGGFLLTEALMALLLLGLGLSAVSKSFSSVKAASLREEESEKTAACAEKILLSIYVGGNDGPEDCARRSTWSVKPLESKPYSVLSVTIKKEGTHDNTELFEALSFRS